MVSRFGLVLALALLPPAAEALTVRVVTSATIGLQGNHEGTASGWFDYDTEAQAVVDAEMTTVFTPPGNGGSKGQGGAHGHTKSYDEKYVAVRQSPGGGIVFRFFANKGQQNKDTAAITIGFEAPPDFGHFLGALADFSLLYPGEDTITPVDLQNVSVMASYEGAEVPLPASLPLALAALGALAWTSRRRR